MATMGGLRGQSDIYDEVDDDDDDDDEGHLNDLS